MTSTLNLGNANFARHGSNEYLGLIIEEGKMSMDPGKLKGIQEWPVPKNVKQVRSWLGFGNFYRKFIQGFSHLAQPLNQLLKKTRLLSNLDLRKARKVFGQD